MIATAAKPVGTPVRPAGASGGAWIPPSPPVAAAAPLAPRRRFEPLTAAQRLAVEEARGSRRSCRRVGREVGLHHSTVSRMWKVLEADDARPRRVSLRELRAVAEAHSGERLRVHVTISLLGREWSPVDLVPPALSVYNHHALASGVGSELLRSLNGELAKS